MEKVKIKHPNPSSKIRLLLLSIISTCQIYASKIIAAYDGFITITKVDKDVKMEATKN